MQTTLTTSPAPVWGGLSMASGRQAIAAGAPAALVLHEGTHFAVISRRGDDRYPQTTGTGCAAAGDGYGVWWLNLPTAQPQALLRQLDELGVAYLPEVIAARRAWADRVERDAWRADQDIGTLALESRVLAAAALRGEAAPPEPEVEPGDRVRVYTSETLYDAAAVAEPYYRRQVVEATVVRVCRSGRIEVQLDGGCCDVWGPLDRRVVSPWQIVTGPDHPALRR